MLFAGNSIVPNQRPYVRNPVLLIFNRAQIGPQRYLRHLSRRPFDTRGVGIAFNQGITTSPGYYAFRDHFLLVGPPSNPANISKTADILTIFSQLRATADAAVTELPVRFLSRYDKSATNIKESSLWIGIGQVSDDTTLSSLYSHSQTI
jgi:hypothetical protein